MTATESDTTASTLAEFDEQIERLEYLARLACPAWERDFEKYGVRGLRTTRLQVYRAVSRATKRRR
jgi:hypothetical protein